MPLGRAALEGHAVAGALEGDDRVVALLGPPIGHRLEVRLAVAQLVEDLLDHRLVDGLDFRLELEVLEIAELDLGPYLDGRLEEDRLALLGLHEFHLGGGERVRDPVRAWPLGTASSTSMLEGLVQDGRGAEDSLHDRPGRLARPEAGYAVLRD